MNEINPEQAYTALSNLISNTKLTAHEHNHFQKCLNSLMISKIGPVKSEKKSDTQSDSDKKKSP